MSSPEFNDNQKLSNIFANGKETKNTQQINSVSDSSIENIWAKIHQLHEEAHHIRETLSKRQKTPPPVRGLRRNEAAGYIGVSATKFDEMVKHHKMPSPIRTGGRVIWDIHELDEYFDALREANKERINFDEDALLEGWQ